LVRSGIEQALQGVVELIHGPGCPVCVTDPSVIDFAVSLSQRPNTLVTSFGDMIRVPGSATAERKGRSLRDAKADGGQVQMVYSPVDALRIAAENDDQQVVFLAVGFETTVPATAIALRQAKQLGIENFSVIPAHVRVLPAMEQLVRSADCRVEGFLAAGHVCVITGYQIYESFAAQHKLPVVVTGFEPTDLLEGILQCVECLEADEAAVVNRYGRNVRSEGNPAALRLIDEVYRPVDRSWRGFGVIPGGGFDLQPAYQAFDARTRFAGLNVPPGTDDERCRGSDVLSGKIKPIECPEFNQGCTPQSPLGAPMVSSEGACAAYQQVTPISFSIADATDDRPANPEAT
jgi:hydrogenase expression/formation protein HypD